MYRSPWWHVAVVGTSALGAALVLAGTGEPWRLATGLGASAALVVAWFAIGQFAFTRPRLAVLFSAMLAIIVPVAILGFPTLAFLQCVALPLLWVFAPTTRAAIVWNAVTTGLGAVAFGITLGGTLDALLQGVLAEGFSLAFSVAIGFWISGLENRSEERLRLLDELRSTQGQLAALEHDRGIRAERERIARELHDTIAQSLTGIVVLAQGARTDLEAQRLEPLGERLTLIEEASREALGETRTLVAASANVEVPGGIAPALRRLAERFERESGVTVAVDLAVAPALSRENEVVLLRCAQEALANARKHSRATRVRLEVRATDGAVVLTVADDGTGFDVEAPSSGFGLTGMRDRVALAGGRVELSSGSGGTRVAVSIPTEVTA